MTMRTNCIFFYVTTVFSCFVFSVSYDPKDFVKLHDQGRVRLQKGEVLGQPCARNMPPVVWDNELAEKAQKWASKCQAGHDSNSERKTKKFDLVGQNWAGGYDLQGAFNAWFDEYRNYNYANRSCTGVCGHYTQIVWNETTHIGCGFARCPSQPWRHAFVCNYGPAGNMRMRTLNGAIIVLPPYEESSTCPGHLK
ncbi:GLIPR1-like protein 1 [Clonorchis sinensis]